MEFIKIGKDRFLVKDSNGLIVSKKDIKVSKKDTKEDKQDTKEDKQESCSLDNKECKQCVAKVSEKGELIEESIKPENIK